MRGIVETQMLSLNMLESNYGQIDGLPTNPRQLVDVQFERLKKSIKDNPEMLGMRELIVYPYDGKYVVVCGNMRLRAMEELGYRKAPCKVLDANVSVDFLKELTIKDNVNYGEWDEKELRESWNDVPLLDWGVELAEEEEKQRVKDDNDGKIEFSLKFTPDQFHFIKKRLMQYDKDNGVALLMMLGYGEE